MQIHELNSFTGSPGAGDYFVIDDGNETTKISAEDFGSTFASVIDAYPITGATPLTAGWLSATNGGAALTPEENRIYILMAASGTYAANTMFRWNSSAYEPLTSGGGSGTSVPTADTLAEWDGDVHMNSEDMTAQEVSDFVDGVDGQGANLADYVVEEGTDGIWTYRKWNSGIAECWAEKTYTLNVTSQWTSFYITNPAVTGENLPFSFIAPPMCQITNKIGNCWIMGEGSDTSSTTKVQNWYPVKPTSASSYPVIIDFSVKGRWK